MGVDVRVRAVGGGGGGGSEKGNDHLQKNGLKLGIAPCSITTILIYRKIAKMKNFRHFHHQYPVINTTAQ